MSTLFLVGLYVACELIANITATKPVTVFGLVAPGGVFIYALTFTLIDLINEQTGRQGARRVVGIAFTANILLAGYTILIAGLPWPEFYTGQDAFVSVLGSTPRIVAASLIAYAISSLIDVEVFAFWKERVRGPRWARVLTSNAVSTLVDSIVFVAIAFVGTLPILPLIVGQYALKMMVTIVSIPLLYVVRQTPVRRGDAGESA